MGEEHPELTAAPAQEQKALGVHVLHNHGSNEAAQQAPGQLYNLAESGHLHFQKERTVYKGLLCARCVCMHERDTGGEKALFLSC